jgi:Gas vesicle protein G
VILIDSLLLGGIRFVFDKLAQAVDAELTDDTVLREELLAAQMRLELGEITEEEFAEAEASLLRRIREVRDKHTATPGEGALRIAGVEAAFAGDEHDADGSAESAPPEPEAAKRRRRRRG